MSVDLAVFRNKLVTLIEKIIGQSLQLDQVNVVTKMVSANLRFLTDESCDLAELAMEYISKYITTRDQTDLKSVKDIKIDNFVDMPKMKTAKIAILSLDSRYGAYIDNRKRLQWSVEESAANQQITSTEYKYGNVVNIFAKMRNITYMRMYSFVLRSFTSTLKRASILIDEFNTESFFLDARQCHFVSLLNDVLVPIDLAQRGALLSGLLVVDGEIDSKVELLSGYRFNEGTFRFSKPVTKLPSTITLSVADPTTVVPFIQCFYRNCNASVSVDATYGTKLTITLPNSLTHGLTTVALAQYWNLIRSIQVSEFTTSSAATDATIISWINSREHTAIKSPSDSGQIEIMLEKAMPPGNYSLSGSDPVIAASLTTLPAIVGTPEKCDILLRFERKLITFEFGFTDFADN